MSCVGIALCNFKSCQKGLECEMKRLEKIKYKPLEFQELGTEKLFEELEKENVDLKLSKKWIALKKIILGK